MRIYGITFWYFWMGISTFVNLLASWATWLGIHRHWSTLVDFFLEVQRGDSRVPPPAISLAVGVSKLWNAEQDVTVVLLSSFVLFFGTGHFRTLMFFSWARFGTCHRGSSLCASGQQLRIPRHQSPRQRPPLCPPRVKGPIGPQQALSCRRIIALLSIPHHYIHYWVTIDE